MADVDTRTEDWFTLPWKTIHCNVHRLQRRIYQAARRNDVKQVHNLQRLLLHSWSARCLAVRKVTQDNRGKRTPGVDGVAALTPPQRLQMAKHLRDLEHHQPAPLRRVYIPKPGKPTEQRPLSIPTMLDRAYQALVKLALEPEWEARFEANSYGFRPGRSTHDAIESIFNYIQRKPKFVLDADIRKCFDRISHSALLSKLHTLDFLQRLIQRWLKAGIFDHGEQLFPEAGVPQGSPLSPLLANIALHGLENAIRQATPRKQAAGVIRYADDLVIIHPDLPTLQRLQDIAAAWLKKMGLELHPEKTRIVHTLETYQDQIGFDFLGFHIRQYPVNKYHCATFRNKPGFKTIITPSLKAIQTQKTRIRDLTQQYRGQIQSSLIRALNAATRGWTHYYHTCCAADTFHELDRYLYVRLVRWAYWRHPSKGRRWCYERYWQRRDSRILFSTGHKDLEEHAHTKIKRHVKVQGTRSPFDGDWIYWATRLGREPGKPYWITRLLKQQQGQCKSCGLYFTTADVLEIHHNDGNRHNRHFSNLSLLHGHCHDIIHSKQS